MITLDYFKTHPLRVAKSQADVTIGSLLTAEKATILKPAMHPSMGAYIHYGGVELADMLTITKPDLSASERADLAKYWYGSCGAVTKQLMFYVWRIVSKELRHGNAAKCHKAFSSGTFDPDAVALCTAISSQPGNYMDHVANYPHITALDYIEAVEQNYRHGGWAGAFGGKKWADIALVLLWYLKGDISAMLAADRAWSLVHNTGPIFNKGFYFTLHDGNLQALLNAQAASSVFTMADEVEALYSHQVLDQFKEFKHRALAAIQKVKPEYQAGDGGGVHADGSKASEASATTTENEAKITAHPFGVYTINTTNERKEA